MTIETWKYIESYIQWKTRAVVIGLQCAFFMFLFFIYIYILFLYKKYQPKNVTIETWKCMWWILSSGEKPCGGIIDSLHFFSFYFTKLTSWQLWGVNWSLRARLLFAFILIVEGSECRAFINLRSAGWGWVDSVQTKCSRSHSGFEEEEGESG